MHLNLRSNRNTPPSKLVDADRDASGGLFLAVTCGNGHTALAGLINSFWCRIVWDSVVVNLSMWEIMSDLAVANLGMEIMVLSLYRQRWPAPLPQLTMPLRKPIPEMHACM